MTKSPTSKQAYDILAQQYATMLKAHTALNAEHEQLHATVRSLERQLAEEHTNVRAAQEQTKQARSEHADLKQRLLAAEQANQFMRGYLARVQEDDVVREELVPTGEPGGEQQMVPKRKPTPFSPPNDLSYLDTGDNPIFDRMVNRVKPRHWITY